MANRGGYDDTSKRRRGPHRSDEDGEVYFDAFLPTVRPQRQDGPCDCTADGGFSIDRYRSLRRRILERAGLGAPMMSVEPTRDVYAHERPLGPKAVYDVSRLSTAGFERAEAAVIPEAETLLMHHESAVLVKSLEGRLGEALKRISSLEADVEASHRVSQSLNEQLALREKDNVGLLARNEELLKQVDEVRKSSKAELEALKGSMGAAATAQLDAARKVGAEEVDGLNKQLADERARSAALASDKARLESIVVELKEQLSVNAASLQSSTSMVRQLTDELLQARQSTTFISTGYKQQEADARAMKATIAAHLAEIAALKPLAARAERFEAEHAKLEAEIRKSQLAESAATTAQSQLESAKQYVKKLEVENAERDARISELLGLLEHVRAQASAAYQHTRGFLASEPSRHPHAPRRADDESYAPPPPSYTLPPQSDAWEALRREVEVEERRTAEEAARWRQSARSL